MAQNNDETRIHRTSDWPGKSSTLTPITDLRREVTVHRYVLWVLATMQVASWLVHLLLEWIA